jgi:hypothetical protein
MIDKIAEWQRQRADAQQEAGATQEDQGQQPCSVPLSSREVRAWAYDVTRQTGADDQGVFTVVEEEDSSSQ